MTHLFSMLGPGKPNHIVAKFSLRIETVYRMNGNLRSSFKQVIGSNGRIFFFQIENVALLKICFDRTYEKMTNMDDLIFNLVTSKRFSTR